VSAIVLCFASLASGALGTLLTFRILFPRGLSLWQLVRALFSGGLSLLAALLPGGFFQ
jgi:hypothetical protein